MEGWAGLRGQGGRWGELGRGGGGRLRTRRATSAEGSAIWQGVVGAVGRQDVRGSGELLPRHLGLKQILRPEQESPSVPPRMGRGAAPPGAEAALCFQPLPLPGPSRERPCRQLSDNLCVFFTPLRKDLKQTWQNVRK